MFRMIVVGGCLFMRLLLCGVGFGVLLLDGFGC